MGGSIAVNERAMLIESIFFERQVKRFRLDFNVILYVILNRRPGVETASALWAAIERDYGRGAIPAHGVTTIFYIPENGRGAPFARNGIERLIGVDGVAPVNEDVLRRALAFGWPDFKYAVCAAVAEASACDVIFTRDPDGYPGSPVPVIDATAALSRLARQG